MSCQTLHSVIKARDNGDETMLYCTESANAQLVIDICTVECTVQLMAAISTYQGR